MAKAWYYVDASDDEVGPVSASDIRYAVEAGVIEPTTLVWRDDMPDWVEAGKIRKLFPELHGGQHSSGRSSSRKIVRRAKFAKRDGPAGESRSAEGDWLLNDPGGRGDRGDASPAGPSGVEDDLDLLSSMDAAGIGGGILGASVIQADRESRSRQRKRIAADREEAQRVDASAVQRLVARGDVASAASRLGASLIDLVAVCLLRLGPGVLVWLVTNEDTVATLLIGVPAGLVLPTIYHASFEASALHGSPGKRLLGLVVTDLGGRPVGFGRALSRNIARVLAILPCGAGYVAVAVTDDRQGYHDYLVGTLVCRRRSAGGR